MIKIDELQEFYEDFAERIVAFDPLDRVIADVEDVDQMTKSQELKNIVE